MAGKIFIAKHNAVVQTKTGPVTLQKDVTRVREGHHLLEGNEALFREDDRVHYELEDARSAPQDAPQPVPLSGSTVQPTSRQDTASHEGPASIDPASQGPASEDPPNQGLTSDSTPGTAPAQEGDEEYANPPKRTPRRGPRKQG
jgi:hypothetical protein